ncbi:MAG: hypothetical protein HC895_02835 [Leptolyngbyaceae cyanobacterium SM1_3_5]|nr:hypothetical protein [Leptolyngbyaceae cyanobacterium SM1_3_5]
MNRRSDNTFGGARPLQFDRTIRDSVGQRDRIDIYKFTASSAGNFSMRLNGLRGNANVRLLNGQFGTIAASNQSRNRPEQIRANLETGTYYLQVQYVDRRGATPYRLQSSFTPNSVPPPPPPPPVGDNSIATAFDIGTITTTTIREEFVGIGDPVDFHKFTLNDITNLRLGVEVFGGGGRFELIRDDNNNGLVDDEVYASSFGSLPPLDIPPGTYYLRASSTSTTRYRLSPPPPTIYRLTFVPMFFGGNVSPDPGNTLATAFDLGVYSGTRLIREYVGEFDSSDIYRFTLNDLSNIQINAGRNNLVTQLYRDDNSNGLIDDNETYYSLTGSLNEDMPQGTYFIGIRRNSVGSTASYEMRLVGTPFGGDGLPDPGSTLPTARDLGVLSGTSSQKEYVGDFDRTDVYKFTLNNDANLQARVTSSSNVGVAAFLIRDTNNNGLIDSSETITSGTSGSNGLTRNLQAGTYFLRLTPNTSVGGFSMNYQLDLIVP